VLCSKNIWSADEVGVSGLGTSDLVVASRYARRVYQIQSCKEHCSLMGCYSTTGSYIPPFFIFAGQRAGKGLLDGSPLGSVVGMSESGWMNEDLFYKWLEFFTHSIPPSRPAVLIVDNHESRFSLRIIQYCIDNQITILLLPPNATHLMQVGDVSIHAPFKKELREQAGIFLHNHPRATISKYHYAQIIAPAYTKAFSPTNITSGYRATGILPYNPEQVKQHLTSTIPNQSLNLHSSSIPLSDILVVPGAAATPRAPASTPRKRRPSMPFTRVLTSDEMKDYFSKQEEEEKKKEQEKLERKQAREEKKRKKAQSTTNINNNTSKKQRTESKEEKKEQKQLNKPSIPNDSSSSDEVEEDDDMEYTQTQHPSSSTQHTTASSQSTRPRRVAADAANIKIYLDDYSW
jgi:hypothetical protein